MRRALPALAAVILTALPSCSRDNAVPTGASDAVSQILTASRRSTATLSVSPNPATILVSSTQQFTATWDGRGNSSAIKWSVTSGSGTITKSGLFTAGGAPGVTIVSARRGHVSATASVNVVATRLVFARQPGVTPAGSRILFGVFNGGQCSAADTHIVPITVRAVDQTGRFVPNGEVTLTLGANPAGGTLSGTLSERAQNPLLPSDVAFSDVRIDAVGNGYTLIASAPGMLSATSAPFDIVPGTNSEAVRLFFNQVVCTNGDHGNVWPAGTVSRRPIEVIALNDNWTLRHGIEGEVDPANDLATTFAGPVTIAVESGGRLTGTLTVTAVGGRATFADLVPLDPGPYVITATTPGLIANRWSFNVTAQTASVER